MAATTVTKTQNLQAPRNKTSIGLALEFFQRNAKSYSSPQPRAPWNLEPHVAEHVFRDMLQQSNVTLLLDTGPVQFAKWREGGGSAIASITVGLPGSRQSRTLSARVFIDASYEGDLLAVSNLILCSQKSNAGLF